MDRDPIECEATHAASLAGKLTLEQQRQLVERLRTWNPDVANMVAFSLELNDLENSHGPGHDDEITG